MNKYRSLNVMDEYGLSIVMKNERLLKLNMVAKGLFYRTDNNFAKR